MIKPLIATLLLVSALLGCKATPVSSEPTLTTYGRVIGPDDGGLEGVWVGLVLGKGKGNLPDEVITISETITDESGAFEIMTNAVADGSDQGYWLAARVEGLSPYNLRTQMGGGKEVIRRFWKAPEVKAGMPALPDMAPIFFGFTMWTIAVVETGPKR